MSQATWTAVRTLLVVIIALVGGAISVKAQQSEPSAASLKRIWDALQHPQHLVSSDGPLISPSKSDEVPLGVMTLVPPETRAQFVSIQVPVGALVARAVHSIAVCDKQ